MTNIERFDSLCFNFSCQSKENMEGEVNPKHLMENQLVCKFIDMATWEVYLFGGKVRKLTEEDCRKFFEESGEWNYWWN